MTSDRAAMRAPQGRRSTAGLAFRRPEANTLGLVLSGDWTLDNELPLAEGVQTQIESTPGVRRLTFDAEAVQAWDSGLLLFVIQVVDLCSTRGIDVVEDGLPIGARRLLSLAAAVPERKGARKDEQRPGFLAEVGNAVLDLWRSTLEMLAFLGECVAALVRLGGGERQQPPRADGQAVLDDIDPATRAEVDDLDDKQ